jgi:hypothetical protein
MGLQRQTVNGYTIDVPCRPAGRIYGDEFRCKAALQAAEAELWLVMTENRMWAVNGSFPPGTTKTRNRNVRLQRETKSPAQQGKIS